MGGNDSYPSQLEEILNQRNIGINFSVINKGVPSITTSYILAHLEQNLDIYQPDMVTAMMGDNDQYLKYYKDIPEANTFLFNKLRTYRLARLFWTNTINKIKKKGIYKPQTDTPSQPDYPLIGLRACYVAETNPVQTEESLKKAIKSEPNNDKAYLELGLFYKEQGEEDKAEEWFKKALELNPRNFRAHFELGSIYRDQRRYIQAEQALKKTIDLNPRNEGIYILLSQTYHLQGKTEDSEKILRKLIEINPQSDMAYAGLGMDYAMAKKYSQAEESFKKSIALNPKNCLAYYHLGKIYMYEQRFILAEEMFKMAGELDPGGKAYKNLILLYEIQGKTGAAQEYVNKLRSLRQKYNNVMTRRNYHKLKETLDERGIKLVCIQYPVLSVEPLKKIFEGEWGVIFVDNEKIFKDALKKGDFKEYFIDMFSGEFGHCTRKGNRLLAENIANAIFKEYFSK
jgi:tetratricopeptide (TPR) repeat protein